MYNKQKEDFNRWFWETGAMIRNSGNYWEDAKSEDWVQSFEMGMSVSSMTIASFNASFKLGFYATGENDAGFLMQFTLAQNSNTKTLNGDMLINGEYSFGGIEGYLQSHSTNKFEHEGWNTSFSTGSAATVSAGAVGLSMENTVDPEGKPNTSFKLSAGFGKDDSGFSLSGKGGTQSKVNYTFTSGTIDLKRD